MKVYYGTRFVDMKPTEQEKQSAAMMGAPVPDEPVPTPFDFSLLEQVPLSIKLDVGGSAYWSEIAQMNTLDNLLMQGQINVVDYLERIPNGYISNQEELLKTLRERMGMMASAQAGATPPGGEISGAESNVIKIPTEAGYGQLQRTLNEGGPEGLNLDQIRI
jgi:hypothetical protein